MKPVITLPICLVVLSSACGGLYELPPTGLYTLTVRSLTDSCAPPKSTGTFEGEPLFVHGATGTSRVGVRSAGQLPTITFIETPLDGGVADRDGEMCLAGGTYHRVVDVTDYDPQSMDVTVAESWVDVASCGEDAGVLDTLPAFDCSATQTLHYELTSACAEPCKLMQDTPLTAIKCVCP